MDRVLILCGGDGRRWANYQGTRKHLLKIGGVRLLERSISLVLPFCQDIRPVVRDQADIPADLAIMPGIAFEIARNRPAWGRGNNWLSSVDYWNRAPGARTVILFGDVFYTQAAIRRIMEPERPGEWGYLNRMSGNRITGKPYWEGFGWSLPSELNGQFLEAAERFVKAEKAGRYSRNQSAGRAVALEMMGIDCGLCGDVQRDYAGLVRPYDYRHHLLINDLTDDFDLAEDYDLWFRIFGEKGPGKDVL